MEGTGLVAQGDEVTSANQDAEFWSRLEPAICDMILEKLPDVERYELRVVCKEWYCTALRSMEHKPYLVSIVRREYEMEREYVGIHEFDADSKSLVVDIERLVPIRLGSTYRAVDGLVFCEYPAHEQEWCVYNIHTRAKHLVPPAPGSGVKYFYEINGMMHMRPPALGSEVYISGMMVDTSVKPYTFKLVVSYRNGEETQIYDSASRLWSLHPNSKPHSNSSVPLPRNDSLFLTMCHKGSMYMSSNYWGGSIFVYSMEEDEWTIVRGVPTRALGRPFLGAWDDRIFAVVHEILDLRDGVVGNVVVWEQVDGTQHEWVEYARCPKAQCEQILAHCTSFFNESSDLVTVFCEEYVLTQHWSGLRSYDLVLFNLKSREWESYNWEEDEDSVPDYGWEYEPGC
ncbi:hypothetical protein M758_1G043400 [Ceratodon purpureus]|nr:hypothetical protein M758_1G043400 [Ceratodon purpureus]